MLCGKPAPRVTWFFDTIDRKNEILPIKVKDFGYIYVLKLPTVSINMCGKNIIGRSSHSIENICKL